MHDDDREAGGMVGPQTPALRASIERISADLEIVLRDQELNRSLLEELRGQLTVIRQVVDYILFVSPENAKDENDLYPFSNWLSGRLEKIMAACERREVPAISEEQLARLSLDRTEIIRELEEFGTTVRRALEHVSQRQQTGLSALIEGQDKLLSRTAELTAEILKRRVEAEPKERLSPYDDLDLQLEEIRQLLKEIEPPSRVYENFFFGLVIFMLLVIIALLFWVRISV